MPPGRRRGRHDVGSLRPRACRLIVMRNC
jgi:hypothetical protein